MLITHQPFLKTLNIILCSQSKGRKLLLEQLNSFEFIVIPSSFEENLDKSQFKSTKEYVKATCKGKVNDLVPKLNKEKWDILIFADTICDFQGKIIEKPQTPQQCIEYFKLFNGNWHQVHTFVTVVAKDLQDNIIERDFIETTDVKFANLSEEAIQNYVLREDLWRGKAGGYAIQTEGMSLISEIKGCYANIIGLPVTHLCSVLLDVIQFLQKKQ